MNICQVERLISQVLNHKYRLMKVYNLPMDERIDKYLVQLYRLKSQLEEAEKRNAVIDSILN